MDPIAFVKENVGHLASSFDSAFVVSAGGVGITQYVLWMFITLALTLVVVLTAAKRLTLVPNNKFVTMIEMGFQFIRRDMGENIIGHGYKKHVPFLAALFFFILISNIMGLVPGAKTPTGALSITWALAIISFIYFNFWGIKKRGGIGYLKSLCPSGLPLWIAPVVWALEVLSTCLRALTLAVRLYGNMFAGHMALGVFSLFIFAFCSSAIQNFSVVDGGLTLVWLALLVAMYTMEVLVAFVQAYVFTMLSAVYIQLATTEH
ncbi:F0F1 ATP synthase subunit A [Eggerthellaceae bacterium zg-1084]|uniref:ATP synthase subunit a n=1 Tax=Berryella wangjianweii TaxID=2734634 RepID=A0A6M8J9D7_9ACTN|nr:F0F1 ATP synthase subunit A [Berryella wangjianweii]NPD30793.1 F0F1 ATP synthase subunit A [Berryella wangjianweii]NPD31988.1 F0F1 ATP synthase subunit A [Eggerthellaceae bacterium zg-997]QKF07422.1 F0F1 ATP synthase subunit A [Berryella wangjianweii]